MTPETSTSHNLIGALRQQDLRPLVFEEFKHSFWQVERVLRGESFKSHRGRNASAAPSLIYPGASSTAAVIKKGAPEANVGPLPALKRRSFPLKFSLSWRVLT
ncbi:hypothetical protein CDAR_575861 [Caerostris darwini]|uniref:Uncharacterized protein n=1 Tax=Caerostris darwini TaxID=1538125 RepID=A0AAV4X855_9ARAC|nr:hypothetical protein CDAR_575861 [Caerostris darwini]